MHAVIIPYMTFSIFGKYIQPIRTIICDNVRTTNCAASFFYVNVRYARIELVIDGLKVLIKRVNENKTLALGPTL